MSDLILCYRGAQKAVCRVNTRPSTLLSEVMPPKEPLWKQLDRQYKKSRRDWQKPSPCFRSKAKRLPSPARPATEAVYDPPKEKIRAPTAWAKTKAPQRPAFKAPTDLMYDPPVIHDKLHNGAPSLRSHIDRLPEPPKLEPGQSRLIAGSPIEERGKKGGKPSLLTFRSKTPRLEPSKVANQADCEVNFKTIASGATKKPLSSSWAKSKAPQRQKFVAPTDLMYDTPPVSVRSKHADCSSFRSLCERFEEPKEVAPPVGTYTSALISAGMLAG